MTREELLAKIEAATGPGDDKTACEIWALGRGDVQIIRGPYRADDGGDEYLITYMDGTYNYVNASELPDRSIDAALGLVERLLPGSEYELSTIYCVARATLPLNSSDGLSETGENKSCHMPLAILAALLRALPPSNEAAR